MSKLMRVDSSSVAKGSLQDVAERQGIDLQTAMLGCEIVVCIDQSGSMSERDARGGKSRYTVADEELRKIQERYPGQVAVIEFSNHPQFCYSGIPSRSGGTTDLAEALRFMKMADGIKGEPAPFLLVVISDGEPDNEAEALQVARTYNSPISTIFIGREGSGGQEFLDLLAAQTGGKRFVADKPGELMPGIVALLGGG